MPIANIVTDLPVSVSVDKCPTQCKRCTAAAVATASEGDRGELVTSNQR